MSGKRTKVVELENGRAAVYAEGNYIGTFASVTDACGVARRIEAELDRIYVEEHDNSGGES